MFSKWSGPPVWSAHSSSPPSASIAAVPAIVAIEPLLSVRRRNGDVDIVADGEAALGERFRVVHRLSSRNCGTDILHAVVVNFTARPHLGPPVENGRYEREVEVGSLPPGVWVDLTDLKSVNI